METKVDSNLEKIKGLVNVNEDGTFRKQLDDVVQVLVQDDDGLSVRGILSIANLTLWLHCALCAFIRPHGWFGGACDR